MPLTLGPLLFDAGIDQTQALVIRHAFVQEPEPNGLQGLHADSTHAEILDYTARQSTDPRRFAAAPPPLWVVFIREGGDQARFWSVVENRGEVANNGIVRTFDIVETEHMADLRSRLVIGWRSPRTWRMSANAAASYCRRLCASVRNQRPRRQRRAAQPRVISSKRSTPHATG